MKIAKERHLSEFEIQSYLYHHLTDVLGAEFIVRGEYTYKGCRFDLAIFKADTRELVCTIETKTRHGNKNSKLSTVNQVNRYHRATGKPCILVTDRNMHSIIGALRLRLAIEAKEEWQDRSARLLRQLPNGALVEIAE